MKKYLKGFVLPYADHVVFYTPAWLGFVVFCWRNGVCFYISEDATPQSSWLYVGAREHSVHLTALRRGYAVVLFFIVALLVFVFYKLGGR